MKISPATTLIVLGLSYQISAAPVVASDGTALSIDDNVNGIKTYVTFVPTYKLPKANVG